LLPLPFFKVRNSEYLDFEQLVGQNNAYHCSFDSVAQFTSFSQKSVTTISLVFYSSQDVNNLTVKRLLW